MFHLKRVLKDKCWQHQILRLIKKGTVFCYIHQQFADQSASVFSSTNVAHIDFKISHFMCTLHTADVTSDSCVFCESALGIGVNIYWASVCVCESLNYCLDAHFSHTDTKIPSSQAELICIPYLLCLSLSLSLSDLITHRWHSPYSVTPPLQSAQQRNMCAITTQMD